MSKEVELSEVAQATSTAAKKQATVTGNVINVDPDKNLAIELLPEGLNAATVRRSQRYIQNVVAGALDAAGEVALEMFKEDDELNKVVVEQVKLFDDSVSFTINRETPKRNPDTGEAVTKYGYVDTTYRSRCTRKSGDMGKVKQRLYSLYEEVLGE